MPAIDMQDVVIEYPPGGFAHRPIDGLTRRIEDGTLTLLLGPSGCGKTTLLSCLGGLLRPAAGSIRVGPTEISTLSDDGLRHLRRTHIGFVFQSFNLIASLDARDNVAAPLIAQGARRREARDRAEAVLHHVGLGGQLRSRPGQLSGGQQQRVAVARSLVHEPVVLLADEPTANLDFVQAEVVIQLLRSLARPGRTVLISTHDDRLLPIADAVVDLTPPVIETSGPTGPLELQAGEVLFHAGERGTLVYVVEEGEVELLRDDRGDGLVAVVGPGRYFGELGPMLGQPRTATARARGDARVRAMSLQEFRVLSRHAAHEAVSAPAGV